MREISIRFEVELLEDLHTGTGVGRLGIVDDTQSRDRQGHPVVWASTFRGLLREAGEDWLWVRQQAGATPAEVDGDRARLYRLLGRTVEESAASAAGIAQVRSLRLVETAISTARPYFLIWASTAREVRSRRPEEQTLRQVEHARAGLIFKGELRFPADDQFQAATHPDTIFLVRLLKRLPSLGGGKTRGWGQIRLCAEPHPEHLPLPSAPTASTACVRLLLENLEPLNLAATALAGNLIRAQSYIPGTRLRAALLHWFSGHGALTLADRLAVPAAMQVGNAYFVPGQPEEINLATVQVMPLPLSVHEPKGGQHTAGKESLPWWAVPAQTPDVMASSNERDMTAFPAPNPGEQDDTGGLYGPRVEFKRVKADEYAVRSGGVWRRVRPQIGVLLRNQVPTTRRDAAQSRHERRTESGLFSEEILSENQCFAADLYFADQPLANEFLKAAAPLLGGDPAVCSWLRIGRGGRPVVIAQSASVPFAEDEEGPADHLTLTLTSDLIARTPWLTFLTELTLADLARLVKEAGGDPLSTAGLSLSRERTFSETSEVYGFNAATGLPRAAAVAIRRGSVFRIERLASSTTILQPWRTALRQAARNGGLGERTAEGFGRFVLDLELHEPFYWKSAKAGEGLAPPIRAADWREEVLVRVNRLLKAFEDTRGQQLNDRSGRHWPSVTQWQWLRSQARVARTDADLAKVLADLRDHAKQLSGAGWGKLPQQLEGTVQEAGQVAMPS